MDIDEPKTSRLLAKMIQSVDGSYRNEFIADAIRAKNLKEFLEKYKSYKKL